MWQKEHTFQTRADWIDALDGLLQPAMARLDVEISGAQLGATSAFYGSTGQRLEAFTRILTGAAFLYSATGRMQHQDACLEILRHGTDPSHAGYWGIPSDFDQRIVEMASLALALGIARSALWDRLDISSRENVAAWLSHINQVQPVANNWILFRLLTNAVLQHLGVRVAMDPSSEDWEAIDRQYEGDGWYHDGPGSWQYDYYIPKGFHLYSLYVAQFHPHLPDVRRDLIHKRAAALESPMRALQAVDGLLLPFGRSLTYRFSSAAYWGGLALAGIGNPSEHRERIARNLSWWARQPICDSGGLLTIGFRYPNLNIAENYNSPASPYFCFHAFLPLLLPEDHPFWKNEAVSQPVQPGKISITPIPRARLIAVNDTTHQHDWALCAGQKANWDLRHHAEKYAKFSYSSRHGFNVTGGLSGLARLGFDSSMAISEDGHHWQLRVSPTLSTIDGLTARTVWHQDGWIEVETALVVRAGMQLREHRVRVFRPLWLVEGAWAVPIDELKAEADGRIDRTAPGEAFSRKAPFFSGVRDLGELLREGSLVATDPNLNVLHASTLIPCLKIHLLPGSYSFQTQIGGYGISESEWCNLHTLRAADSNTSS